MDQGEDEVVFTGIVSEVGRMTGVRGGALGKDLTFECRLAAEGLQAGESIAVSGVCLTAVRCNGSSFMATASAETLCRTTLGTRRPGDDVNLERALRPGDRLGGHFVQGHVDGVGTVRSVRSVGAARVVSIEAPEDLRAHLVDRGSVAADGVSLTVTGVDRHGFEVTLIPTTLEVTTLGGLGRGDLVNLEADILSKYVARALESRTGASERLDVTAWLAAGGRS